MINFAPILIPALSFAAVAATVFVLGQYILAQAKMQRRLPAPIQLGDIAAGQSLQHPHGFIARRFDANHFGIDGASRDKLRRELMKAGYFRADAVSYYILARLSAVLLVPTVIYLLVESFLWGTPALLKIVLVSIAPLVAIVFPDAYLARR